MNINTEKLKELKPCTDRFKNWLEHYSDFEGSFCEFLDLDKITYNDKIFVIRKLVPGEVLEKWAILCAESVLHVFEEKYPNDKRPRECLEYLNTGEKDRGKLDYHRRASYSAAYAADDAAAYAAANAADASYAAHAADAASYASYAAHAADAASSVISEQRKKNLEFLKSLLIEV